MKFYQAIPINECGEPLAPIPGAMFVLADPHPYARYGAPYGDASPWTLRQSVLQALVTAQEKLSRERPGWKIKIVDAYRPNAVQEYMVEREFALLAKKAGLDPAHLTQADRDKLAPSVFRLWAIPSDDPATPPPHSTGSAIDCTLLDADGNEVDMGSPIDENSDRSNPDYFAAATDEKGKAAHENREYLNRLLRAEGFQRDPTEWWHFSRGDQLWAWCERHLDNHQNVNAFYGRAR